MTTKRMSAAAIAVLFGVTSFACLISAHEDEGTPLIITGPSGDDPISCAVFFSDNMVYAPQWRMDNYVRIETMVIDMTGLSSSRDISFKATDLYPNDVYTDLLFLNGLEQQAAIIVNSEEILPLTRMVSVSYIELSLTLIDPVDPENPQPPILFAAGWDPLTGEKVITVNEFGREVNQVGHVIYGTLWDTTGAKEGVYKTEVRLGKAVETPEGSDNWVGVLGEWYSVDYSIAHLYDPAVEGAYVTPEYPYSDLVVEGEVAEFDYATYKIGEGGVEAGVECNSAWLELGPLIPQGSGGGNGGDGGDGGDNGGNGNGHVGEGGGNGHGKRSRVAGTK